MASKLTCPACGAEIEYPGILDEIQCEFCGTMLRFIEKEGEEHLQILPRPEGKQDVLISEPQQLHPEDLESGFPGVSTLPEAADLVTEEAGSGGQPYPNPHPETFTAAKPAAEVQAYPAGSQPSGGAGARNTTLWAGIVIAVVIVLCGLCACVAAAAVAAGGLLAY